MTHIKALFTEDHECSCCLTYSFIDVLDFSYQFLSPLRYAQIIFLEVVMGKHWKLRIIIAGLSASVWMRDIQNNNFFPWPSVQFFKTQWQGSIADLKHKCCVPYIHMIFCAFKLECTITELWYGTRTFLNPFSHHHGYCWMSWCLGSTSVACLTVKGTK